MSQPERVCSKIKIDVLVLNLNLPSETMPWWIIYVIVFVLMIFLQLENTAWAEENYYQIINGSVEAENDNFVRDRGYAVFMNYGGHKFLFDAGLKKENFLDNMAAAGISLSEVDFVVLSHQHTDHTRGWSLLRRERPSLPIYVAAGGGFTYIIEGAEEVTDYIKISPTIFIIHTHDDAGTVDITDELSIAIITNNGPYLFTTNSHTDFIMKLEKVERVLGSGIYYHSGDIARRISPDDQILDIAQKMKEMNVKHVSPSHSSPRHDKIFRQIFGTGYVPAILGKKVPLEPIVR